MTRSDDKNIKEHLLCILPIPEPQAMLESLQEGFPGLKVTYLQRGLKMMLEREEKLADELWSDITILFTLSHFPPDLALAPRLKLAQLCSSGADHISETPIYQQTTIPIATCAGAPAPVIAEWAVMNMLTAAHRYDTVRTWQQNREWNDSAGKQFFGSVSSARGKRLAILGYGAIGRQAASMASCFGMEIVACTATSRLSPESKCYRGFSPPNTGDPEGTIPRRWFHASTKESLHAFLQDGLDYILISVPLTHSTRQLLGKSEIEILSSHNTFVINISRGEILDQDALLQALQTYEAEVSRSPSDRKPRGIAGAALDVATPEPLPKDHPLWNAPNCVISPHVSGYSREYWPTTFEILRTNMKRLREGKRLLNQIDRSTGYDSYGSE